MKLFLAALALALNACAQLQPRAELPMEPATPTASGIVADAIERVATEVDVVVLAQASMASAAASARVDVPVLTSLEPGIKRLSETLRAL